MKINKISVTGNYNIVLQGADGTTNTQTLEEFIKPFTKDKDELINRLKRTLDDKETIQSLSNEKIKCLSADYQQALNEKAALAAQIEKMVQDFSKMDIAESGELYQQAFNLFMSAKLDEALELLNELRLQQDLNKIEQHEQEAKSKRRDLANSFLLRAKILQLKFDFKNAEKSFEKAVSVSPEWRVFIAAGNFFEFLKDYQKAEYCTKQALEVSKNEYQRALTLNNLGNLYIESKDFDLAEASLLDSINTRRKLAESGSEISLSDLAESCNSLATLQMSLDEFDKAEVNFQEALSIRKQLANANPIMYPNDIYRPNVAGLRVNLANLQTKKNRFNSAEVNYKSALRIYEMVIKLNIDNHLPYDNQLPFVAGILLNLANLHLLKKEFDTAESYSHAALKIWRKLAETNPQTYSPDVARVLNNLALLQIEKNDFENAELNSDESLKIYRKLVETNPNFYLTDFVGVFKTIASLQIRRNELDKAETTYCEALATIQETNKLPSDAYFSVVSEIYHNIGDLQEDKNEVEKAKISFQSALDMRRKLAKANKQAYIADVGDTLYSLARLQSKQKDYGGAKTNFREALTIFRILAENNPDVYLPHVAATIWNIAELLKEKDEFEAAEIFFEEALEKFQLLAKGNPNVHLSNVARTQSSLALLQKVNGVFDKAEVNYTEALSLYKSLANSDPVSYRRDVLISLNNIANIQRETIQFEAVGNTYGQALKLLAKYSEVPSNNFEPEIVTLLSNISVFYTYLVCDKEKAINAAKEAIAKALPYPKQSSLEEQIIANAHKVLAHWGESTDIH